MPIKEYIRSVARNMEYATQEYAHNKERKAVRCEITANAVEMKPVIRLDNHGPYQKRSVSAEICYSDDLLLGAIVGLRV